MDRTRGALAGLRHAFEATARFRERRRSDGHAHHARRCPRRLRPRPPRARGRPRVVPVGRRGRRGGPRDLARRPRQERPAHRDGRRGHLLDVEVGGDARARQLRLPRRQRRLDRRRHAEQDRAQRSAGARGRPRRRHDRRLREGPVHRAARPHRVERHDRPARRHDRRARLGHQVERPGRDGRPAPQGAAEHRRAAQAAARRRLDLRPLRLRRRRRRHRRRLRPRPARPPRRPAARRSGRDARPPGPAHRLQRRHRRRRQRLRRRHRRLGLRRRRQRRVRRRAVRPRHRRGTRLHRRGQQRRRRRNVPELHLRPAARRRVLRRRRQPLRPGRPLRRRQRRLRRPGGARHAQQLLARPRRRRLRLPPRRHGRGQRGRRGRPAPQPAGPAPAPGAGQLRHAVRPGLHAAAAQLPDVQRLHELHEQDHRRRPELVVLLGGHGRSAGIVGLMYSAARNRGTRVTPTRCASSCRARPTT